jgi:hypothetical protein
MGELKLSGLLQSDPNVVAEIPDSRGKRLTGNQQVVGFECDCPSLEVEVWLPNL